MTLVYSDAYVLPGLALSQRVLNPFGLIGPWAWRQLWKTLSALEWLVWGLFLFRARGDLVFFSQ